MKRMLMAVLFLAPCVLGNTTPCDAALRRTVIVKGWQPGETFADGSVVNQNNVYFQKRVNIRVQRRRIRRCLTGRWCLETSHRVLASLKRHSWLCVQLVPCSDPRTRLRLWL